MIGPTPTSSVSPPARKRTGNGSTGRSPNPATASQYAFLLYPVKNGAAINRGEMPIEALGVRAAGDRVLEVELENPIAYFDKITAAQTYFPIREDFYKSRNGRYAADSGIGLMPNASRPAIPLHGLALAGATLVPRSRRR